MSCGLKICGVTRAQDVDACVELGVDAIGFNLWSSSPRAVTVEAARALLERMPRPGPLRVAVVVDPDEATLVAWIDALDLDAVQLHGTRSDYPGLAIDRVTVVRGPPMLDPVPRTAARWILLDAAVPGFGGRGVVHDWAWAASARAALAPAPVWLAGGLDPDNAAAAIAAVRPAGIDVASGAEEGVPGIKSRDRIAALRAICDRVVP